jgi:hypothetical protein
MVIAEILQVLDIPEPGHEQLTVTFVSEMFCVEYFWC